MRILFAGSPDISATLLKHLLENQKNGYWQVAGVLTNPDAPKGRKAELLPTSVAQIASTLAPGIPLFKFEHLDAFAREEISKVKADLLVCFAYGKIFGPKFMALFPMGGINVHPSLLPAYRGCAPVPAAILNCEKETGVTVQKLAQEMDTGDILLQQKILLDGSENSESLLAKAAEISLNMVTKVLENYAEGKTEGLKQEGNASYSQMLKKEDGLIDWSESAEKIDAKIRAFYPWPGAFTQSAGSLLRIHEAVIYKKDFPAESEAESGCVLGTDKSSGIIVKTGKGLLALKNVQLQGKKAMNWKDFMNGSRNYVGTVLGK